MFYLASVARALHQAGWNITGTPSDVQHPSPQECTAVVVLDVEGAPASAAPAYLSTTGTPPKLP
ncbi:hypothetical protein GCM10010274_43930 [Streptomyces lavendofoliae]|uniref:Uncharacterized protein n=1 Tax=Streptomyces lavendofoliae TaxID=67314 RepID=A0A918I1Z3_9ACTN|nr:hypothetical protein GCM10010274_43930 [Streptomyces lavendofoliae]